MAPGAEAQRSSSISSSEDSHEEHHSNNSSHHSRHDAVETESLRIEPAAGGSRASSIYRATSHMSGPDTFEPSSDPPLRPLASSKTFYEPGDDVYDRFSKKRKLVILVVLSYCGLLSPISSTTVLAAVPEVAKEFDTSGSVINASNAAYMVLMGLSPIVWGPVSQVFGRRWVTIVTAALFFLLSLATALSPNLASFFIFRALSAFEGTAFILLGAACLSDIYRPIERGSAIGWFMTGSLIGPAFGPFIGGVIVTYSSWRSIFWLQTAMAGAGCVAVFFLIPETIHRKGIEELKDLSKKERTREVLGRINPIRVIKLFRYPNLLLVAMGSSSLLWNMYSLLTPVRYVLNPRFHLETPILGALFYLAPGCGYLMGTLGGGRWADWMVRKWIRKRDGVRVPEDRLRAAIPFMGIVIPGCMLIYGWTVDRAVGGIPAPVITLFIQGVAQLFCFPALNTYCLDVMPGRSAEATAANFFARYLAGCLATAVVLPLIQSIGVGWFETITVVLILVGTALTMVAIRWGPKWREEIEAKEREERRRRRRAKAEEAAKSKEARKAEGEKANVGAKSSDVGGSRDLEKGAS